MKQTILYHLLGIFLLTSCQQEEIPNAETAMGTLSLNGISVQVANETVSSRAVDADLYVETWQNGAIYNNQVYAPGQVPNKIELPVGNYQLRIYNAACQSENPYEGKGQAIFFSDATFFEVKAGEVTRLEEIKVPMINFGVTLKLPEGFDTLFKAYTFSVTLGERTVEWKNGEAIEPAYFPHDTNVTFSYRLEATNMDGEVFSKEDTYAGVVAGTVYTVTYEMGTQLLSVTQ